MLTIALTVAKAAVRSPNGSAVAAFNNNPSTVMENKFWKPLLRLSLM